VLSESEINSYYSDGSPAPQGQSRDGIETKYTPPQARKITQYGILADAVKS